MLLVFRIKNIFTYLYIYNHFRQLRDLRNYKHGWLQAFLTVYSESSLVLMTVKYGLNGGPTPCLRCHVKVDITQGVRQ